MISALCISVVINARVFLHFRTVTSPRFHDMTALYFRGILSSHSRGTVFLHFRGGTSPHFRSRASLQFCGIASLHFCDRKFSHFGGITFLDSSSKQHCYHVVPYLLGLTGYCWDLQFGKRTNSNFWTKHILKTLFLFACYTEPHMLCMTYSGSP